MSTTALGLLGSEQTRTRVASPISNHYEPSADSHNNTPSLGRDRARTAICGPDQTKDGRLSGLDVPDHARAACSYGKATRLASLETASPFRSLGEDADLRDMRSRIAQQLDGAAVTEHECADRLSSVDCPTRSSLCWVGDVGHCDP